MAELNEKNLDVAEESEATEKKEKKSGKPVKVKKPNIFVRFGHYLRDCASELKKVTWLSRKETMKSTGVVLAVVIALSILIGVLDTALEFGVLGLSYLI